MMFVGALLDGGGDTSILCWMYESPVLMLLCECGVGVGPSLLLLSLQCGQYWLLPSSEGPETFRV